MYGAPKERPEITTRKLDEACPRRGRGGFNSYDLYDLVKAGWCIEATGVEHIPESAHWHLLISEEISVSDGRDGTSRQQIWKLYVFDDKLLWEQVVQYYFEDAADMASPTNTAGYNKGPMKLVALEASGKVIPHVVVALAMDPRA